MYKHTHTHTHTRDLENFNELVPVHLLPFCLAALGSKVEMIYNSFSIV